MMRKLHFLLLLLVTIVITSCEHEEVYFRYNEIADGKWRGSDALVFDIDSFVFAPGVPYEVSIEVTNNTNYSYQNIWLFLEDNFKNDSVFAESKYEYTLADEFGKWEGAGFASLYQATFLLNKRLVVTEQRKYQLRISHGMQDEPLVGIEKVGVRIRPTN